MAQLVSDFGETTEVWCVRKEKQDWGAGGGGYIRFWAAVLIKGEDR